MKRNKIITHIDGGETTGCREVGYIMVSNGTEALAIRATTRYTKDGVAAMDPPEVNLPVFNLEEYDCTFTHAYFSGPIQTDAFTIKEMAEFLHEQRMRIADMIGTIKFAELDNFVCMALKEYHD